jgi:hypothetical protein
VGGGGISMLVPGGFMPGGKGGGAPVGPWEGVSPFWDDGMLGEAAGGFPLAGGVSEGGLGSETFFSTAGFGVGPFFFFGFFLKTNCQVTSARTTTKTMRSKPFFPFIINYLLQLARGEKEFNGEWPEGGLVRDPFPP